MMRTIMFAFVACFGITSLSTSSTLQASHTSPLSQAACVYRQQVEHFGHKLISESRLTHYERRFATRLMQTASRFETLARHGKSGYAKSWHANSAQSLRAVWRDLERLHRDIELTLFQHPGCPAYISLQPCWREVVVAYGKLALLMNQYSCADHSFGQGWFGYGAAYPLPFHTPLSTNSWCGQPFGTVYGGYGVHGGPGHSQSNAFAHPSHPGNGIESSFLDSHSPRSHSPRSHSPRSYRNQDPIRSYRYR